MDGDLSFDIRLALGRDQAIDAVTDALKSEGFGVLTRIDVDQTFKAKLDVDFRPYTILGACNPVMAHRALEAVPEIGLMLPCNIVVEEAAPGESLVRIADPGEMMRSGGFAEVPAMAELATEAEARLRRVADALSPA